MRYLFFENCPYDYCAELLYLVVKEDGNEILRTIVGMNDDLDEILLTELGLDSSDFRKTYSDFSNQEIAELIQDNVDFSE